MAVSSGSSVEVGKSDSVEFAGNRRLSSNYAWDITELREKMQEVGVVDKPDIYFLNR